MWRVGSKSKPETPAEWPADSCRPRVLVEEADGANEWAIQQVLERAGYDVAVCGGPEKLVGHRCPLVTDGTCALVEGADMVMNSLSLTSTENRAVVASLQATHPEIPIVVAAPAPRIAQHADLLRGCDVMPSPMTTDGVLSGARRGLSQGQDPSNI